MSISENFIIDIYVCDLLLSGQSDKYLTKVKESSRSQFKMKDMGELHYFLSVKVIQDVESGSIWIGQ